MSEKRSIELLAPAKDLETARQAILHGADAIYIGAPRFGARAMAGVSIEDLQTLCKEAHLYRVRVYVAFNTILYDHELKDAQTLIWEIYRAGADALIIQDMGITMMDLPPIPLHSSTQCDTTTPEDVIHLDALGFDQIVLARELNVEQIRQISPVTSKKLEVFVHGALCVSYSGRCYISQALTNRSANRGECSQQCRLPYTLIDSSGLEISHNQHLLSPKDLNRSLILEELLEAGVSSFKIEGRLKSISYVKNITAYYRKKIDDIIAQHPDKYQRASLGTITFSFSPNPLKSFNRGFTDYQITSPNKTAEKRNYLNPHTPKSQGEFLGHIVQSTPQSWHISSNIALSNGDGLLYITPQGEVGGININRSLGVGHIAPARMLRLPKGTQVFRNHDRAWEAMLSGHTAERVHQVKIVLKVCEGLLTLSMQLLEEPEIMITVGLDDKLELAQKKTDITRLKTELSKLGGTIFKAIEVECHLGEAEYFIPLSQLSRLRREAIQRLVDCLQDKITPLRNTLTPKMSSLNRSKLPKRKITQIDYTANVANHLAEKHYRELGYIQIDKAFELSSNTKARLMTTKYCIRYELGYCTRAHKKIMPYKEPLFLLQGKHRIKLEFDCLNCQMYLLQP